MELLHTREQNTHIMQIIRTDKGEFDKLLALYRTLEKKYQDVLSSPCAVCVKWQLKLV